MLPPRSVQCASCALKFSEWLAPSVRCIGSRHFSSTSYRSRKAVKVRKVQSNTGGVVKNVETDANHLRRSLVQRRTGDAREARAAPYKRSGSPFLRLKFLLKSNYAGFEKLLLEQHSLFMMKYAIWTDKAQKELAAWGIADEAEFKDKAEQLKRDMIECCAKARESELKSKKDNPLFYQLRQAFVTGEVKGLQEEVKVSFVLLAVGSRYAVSNDTHAEQVLDLRYPMEWYPATRALQRTIHLHIGPTNSGKTYHALKRLEEADSGIYAGPLRLLAHEVYTRLNAKGKPCALVTGEEQRIPEGVDTYMKSCTVEMVALNSKVEVAVIDEIQMMGDKERGWAWTQAFLGVQAKEVHLCGEVRTLQLIRDLCAAMGDKLEIHRYERLSPLETMSTSLKGSIKNLQKGDAVILFSRLAIHAMRRDIEDATGKRCAVVYGSLPPETRAQQAALFNDPDNEYDFLVASNAVGMGLNLSIKRIILESVSKHDGRAYKIISVPEIKQIAGRAGRYKTARDAIQESPNDVTDGMPAPALAKQSRSSVGYVTTLFKDDLPVVQSAMKSEVSPLETAGVFPPASVLARYASYYSTDVPFSFILLRIQKLAQVSPRFHFCAYKEQIQIADLIQEFDLTINDRIAFSAAPVSLREPGFKDVITAFAQCVADQSGGELLEIKVLDLELLDHNKDTYRLGPKAYLRELEFLHKALTLYLWLSYRFLGVFTSQALAFHVKSLVEERIDGCLAEVSWEEGKREKIAEERKKALKKQMKRMKQMKQIHGMDLNELEDSPAQDAAVPKEGEVVGRGIAGE